MFIIIVIVCPLCYLRNRSVLAIELLSTNSLFGGQLERRSNHERKARVIYLLTTDRQTVNYYSTIQALELIVFDSNTQETMKKQLYPSDSSNFPPLH